jgi:hypothetical protein
MVITVRQNYDVFIKITTMRHILYRGDVCGANIIV